MSGIFSLIRLPAAAFLGGFLVVGGWIWAPQISRLMPSFSSGTSSVGSGGSWFADINRVVAKRYGESEISTVKNLWDSPRNRAISAALGQDASSGRLIKADFGWSTPAAIKSMLDQYKGKADNCPKV